MAAISQISDPGPWMEKSIKNKRRSRSDLKSERRHSVHMDPPTATSATQTPRDGERRRRREGGGGGEAER